MRRSRRDTGNGRHTGACCRIEPPSFFGRRSTGCPAARRAAGTRGRTARSGRIRHRTTRCRCSGTARGDGCWWVASGEPSSAGIPVPAACGGRHPFGRVSREPLRLTGNEAATLPGPDGRAVRGQPGRGLAEVGRRSIGRVGRCGVRLMGAMGTACRSGPIKVRPMFFLWMTRGLSTGSDRRGAGQRVS